MASDEIPPRNRVTDLPAGNLELILYQLSEIKAQVREGFLKMEGRFDKIEDRVSALERFRSRAEERNEAEAAASSMVNSRWLPLILTLMTLVATIILFVIGQH